MRNISDIYVSRWCLYKPSIELSKGGINSQHPMLYFHNKTPLHDKIIYKEYCQIYVSTFVNSQHSWFLTFIWNIWMTLYVIFSTILFKNMMMKISNIYIRITGYLFQEINIHQWRINIKYSMLDHPIFQKKLIDTYKQEILPPFMLSYGVYITLSLNWVKVK